MIVMAEKQDSPKKGKSNKVWKLYDASGGQIKRLNRSCPKCGSSVFMAKHKDRWTCGSCAYTEFVKK